MPAEPSCIIYVETRCGDWVGYLEKKLITPWICTSNYIEQFNWLNQGNSGPVIFINECPEDFKAMIYHNIDPIRHPLQYTLLNKYRARYEDEDADWQNILFENIEQCREHPITFTENVQDYIIKEARQDVLSKSLMQNGWDITIHFDNDNNLVQTGIYFLRMFINKNERADITISPHDNLIPYWGKLMHIVEKFDNIPCNHCGRKS
jgi:hypothetical protein